MQTVLVTGASGALGQAVMRRLREDANCRSVAASRSSDDVALDLCDPAQISAVIERVRPNLVLHLAAVFGDDFELAYAVNVEATRRLLTAVYEASPATRIVVAGSAAEYGVIRPEENPVREDRVLAPVSTYGLTKAWQTQLAGLHASRGANVVVARIFNLVGPGMSERLFIGRVQKQIGEVLNGYRSAIELGPLDAIRDYVSTDDAVDQLLAIAAHAEPGSVHHIASGIPVSMHELLRRLLEKSGLDMTIVRSSNASTNRTGYDVPEIYADMTRTMKLMNLWRSRAEA
ncbi:MAG: rmd, GDP-4-dehydro-6-deoxy-D-mannose reductase [Paucimonas sp.]|jgi:GDP-4-dehydro-6-deoxy-D-mannose reductase|nr:rmd, GDP-4-dehydro-6-deoxy-D-mannose reductase [Paucimonas sp.]